MPRASILRQLPDERLEELHHAIRRDASSDLEIARAAEKWLGKSLGSDDAAAMTIARYRSSGPYKRWLKNWESQDLELKRQVAAQKSRFEFLSSLVKTGNDDALQNVSRSIQARLLTLAAEMSDDELKEAAAGKNWVKGLIQVVNEAARIERHAREQKAVEVGSRPGLSDADREQKLRQIFGLP